MKKILLLLALLLPVMYLILLSIFSFFRYPVLLPSNFTLEYWQDVLFRNPLFYKGLFSSLLIGFFAAMVSTIIGFMTGRAVVYHFGGYSKHIALLISIPLLIPGMILFLGMHQVILATPFKNSVMGVVLVHSIICLPYSTNIAIAYFTGIPKEYESIAQTLGSTRKVTMRKIVMPLLKPGILMSMSISFLISNTEYFSTFLIGGGKVVSLYMVMFPYISNADYGRSSIMGIVFLAIHIVVFIAVDLMNKNEIKVFYGGE